MVWGTDDGEGSVHKWDMLGEGVCGDTGQFVQFCWETKTTVKNIA